MTASAERTVKKKCPVCGDLVDPKGVYVHFQNKHSEEVQKWDEWKDKFETVEVMGPPPPTVELPEGVEEDQISILKDVLTRVRAKTVSEAAVGAILAIAEAKGGMDPAELYSYLLQYGASDKAARAIMGMYYARLYKATVEARRAELGAYVLPFPLTSAGPFVGPVLPFQPQAYQYPYACPYPIYQPYPVYQPHVIQHWPDLRRQPPVPPRTYKVVIEGQEITTDEEGYRAWLQYKKDLEERELKKEEHTLRVKKLEEEIKSLAGGGRHYDEMVDVEYKGQKIKLPQSAAYILISQLREDELRKRIDEERDARIKAEIEAVRQPSLIEQLKHIEATAPMLGYHKGGRTVLDVLDSLGERIDQRAQQIISRMPSAGAEFKPEITRTPEERTRAVEEIKKRLERSAEMIAAENELLEAAAKVKGIAKER